MDAASKDFLDFCRRVRGDGEGRREKHDRPVPCSGAEKACKIRVIFSAGIIVLYASVAWRRQP
jgi:hypothetical protein